MPQRRISVKKVREIMRLRHDQQLSQSNIAISVGCSRSAVQDCLARAAKNGLSWPIPEDWDDDFLEGVLYNHSAKKFDSRAKGLPDWEYVRRQLQIKGVTRQTLWDEYIRGNPDGYEYSRFCDLFRQWSKKQKISMRQNHNAGEKLFIDYAGKTMPIKDPKTGEVSYAQIFVAVWGVSNYAYVEATWTQQLKDWVGSHVRAFEYFGCVPEVIVPDCLKSAVTKACRYDPETNPTYTELAKHYDTAVIPARPRHPKDKAVAENSVLIITRWILAALRHRTFFSLEELNEAIRTLLDDTNLKPFQKRPGNRLKDFVELDKPAAKPLPKQRYEYAEASFCRAGIDYHISVDNHFYSVPYKLRGERLLVRVTESTIEVLYKNRRVCSHLKGTRAYGYTTNPEHMPSSHRAHSEWTPERLVSWARKSGAHTAALIEGIFIGLQHPEQGYRQCLGIMRLGQKYGKNRLEAAARIAVENRLFRYRHIKSILKNGRDQEPQPENFPKPIDHAFIRGADYYDKTFKKGVEHVSKCNPGKP